MPRPETPLGGVRALGFSHVIAGPGLGRALAYHGADVLNLWTPNDFEMDFNYYSANVGMRSAIMDFRRPDEMARFWRLVAGADIFFANRRPGLLEKLGITSSELARLRPGIVQVDFSIYGAARTLGQPNRVRSYGWRRFRGARTRGLRRRTEAPRDLRRQRLHFILDRNGRRHRRVAAPGHGGRQLPRPRVAGAGVVVAAANGDLRQSLRQRDSRARPAITPIPTPTCSRRNTLRPLSGGHRPGRHVRHPGFLCGTPGSARLQQGGVAGTLRIPLGPDLPASAREDRRRPRIRHASRLLDHALLPQHRDLRPRIAEAASGSRRCARRGAGRDGGRLPGVSDSSIGVGASGSVPARVGCGTSSSRCAARMCGVVERLLRRIDLAGDDVGLFECGQRLGAAALAAPFAHPRGDDLAMVGAGLVVCESAGRKANAPRRSSAPSGGTSAGRSRWRRSSRRWQR